MSCGTGRLRSGGAGSQGSCLPTGKAGTKSLKPLPDLGDELRCPGAPQGKGWGMGLEKQISQLRESFHLCHIHGLSQISSSVLLLHCEYNQPELRLNFRPSEPQKNQVTVGTNHSPGWL